MTEKPRATPDDRELEQYLEGGSALSRRYREASAEAAPPELDEAVLAQARAGLRRKRGPNRWLASLALAASVVLAVNLGWNVYRTAPPAGEAPVPQMRDRVVAAPPPVAAPAAPAEPAAGEADLARRKADAGSAAALRERRALPQAQEQKQEQERQAQASREPAMARREAAPPAEALAGSSADAAAPQLSTALAPPALTEAQKIDRLIAFVGGLGDAVFIRNGDEHRAADAAAHLQMKREKAGKRVQTADDFIRLCASHSYVTKEAYLIRFPDGRTRTAEDVLREELARLEGGGR